MAPRRGGHFGGGGSSSACSSNAFALTSNRIYLGYFIAFLLVDAVLLSMASRRLFKPKRGGPLVRWLLMLSIILSVFIHGWDLLFLVLGECNITDVDLIVKLSLVSGFLGVIATSSLVGAVMVSICKRLHQVANMSPRVIAIIHGLWAAGFAFIYFVAACLFAVIATREIDFSSSSRRRRGWAGLVVGWNGVMTFAAVVLLLGMLSTAFNLISSMSRCKALKTSSLRRDIPFLALSSVCFGASFLAHQILAYRVSWKAVSSFDLRDGYYAVVFLSLFFYSSTFLFALLVATSPALTDNELQNVAQDPNQQQTNYAYPIQSQTPLMQQYSQQPYTSAPQTQPYQPPHQLYDPHHNPAPTPSYT
ncbi:hypothetical protein EMCG_03625 [[Emmonsia] crescens]|uniref:Uncharacterized protein n=1 Tax=[Emmonsia] crescens TaxID=73230 RepID=A0A0G2J894_9EURO|nr:hypothetical protein EMCG_03625 [Emmonsia crescens UAMH 3008]